MLEIILKNHSACREKAQWSQRVDDGVPRSNTVVGVVIVSLNGRRLFWVKQNPLLDYLYDPENDTYLYVISDEKQPLVMIYVNTYMVRSERKQLDELLRELVS